MDWLRTYSRYMYPVYCLMFTVYLFSSMAYAGAENVEPAEDEVITEDDREMTAEEDKGMTTEEEEEEGDEMDTEEAEEEEIKDEIEIPEMVATVNGVNITGQELKERLAQGRAMDTEGFDVMNLAEKKMEITRVLDGMVLHEVGYQEAIKRKIVVTDEEVDMRAEDVKRRFSSEEEFEEAIASTWGTVHSWKEAIRKNLMVDKLEEMDMNGVEISDKEIEVYYEKNKKGINKDSIKVSHILVKTEEEAREVVKEIEKKEDFADLAKKYSIDTYTKDKGGDLGWYSRGELLPEAEEAAHSLSPGQISGPVKSQFGYHIIRLDEKKPASEQTLEDHREHVRTMLQMEKWKDLRLSWVRLLLNKAKIWKWEPEDLK